MYSRCCASTPFASVGGGAAVRNNSDDNNNDNNSINNNDTHNNHNHNNNNNNSHNNHNISIINTYYRVPSHCAAVFAGPDLNKTFMYYHL